MSSSEGSPIDDVFPLDLVDGIRGYFGLVFLWILCMVISVTPEQMVVTIWVIGECDGHQSPQCIACQQSHVFWCDVPRRVRWRVFEVMVNSGSVTVSRGWSRCLSGGAPRFITIHLFVEHAHYAILFVHQVLILIDEDTNLVLQCRNLVLAAADCSS